MKESHCENALESQRIDSKFSFSQDHVQHFPSERTKQNFHPLNHDQQL